jgi:hypothetical protein
VNLCYITLEIPLICANMERVSFQCPFEGKQELLWNNLQD